MTPSCGEAADDAELKQSAEKQMQQLFCLSMAAVTDLICLHWPVLHVEIPDFDRQIVTGHHVASTVAELDIRNG